MPRAKRGEIWMADLGLAAKVRPVLVLSVSYEGQERAIVSYVVRTTSLRDTKYEVRHETRGMPKFETSQIRPSGTLAGPRVG